MRRALVAISAMVLVLTACSGRSERQTVLPPLPSSIPRAETTIGPPPLDCQLAIAGRGAEVVTVRAGTAAEGVLEAGDVITALDGFRITTSADLVAVIQSYLPGDQVALALVRQGEPIVIEFVLGEHPDLPDTALMGVEVATPIATFSPENLPSPPDPVLGPFVRGVAVEGIIYLLDPVPGTWQPYSDAPNRAWAAISNGIYSIRPDETHGAVIELVGTDFERPFQGEGWDVPILVSSVGGLGISIAREALGLETTESSESVILAIDPGTGEIAWIWAPEEPDPDQVPLFAYASPAHDRVVVLLGSPSTQEASAHVVLGPDGQELTGWPDQGAFLPPGALVVGWFDQDSLLYAVPPGAGVFAFDLTTRESLPVTVPGDVASGSVLWATGDGRHLIVLSTDGLLLLDTLGGETRPLATGCAVAAVGDAGALTG
ncbi:MAG: PDZ domain-containing protein [Acidimicrobiia bacterium]